MHDAYIGRRFLQTKITRKASDVAEKNEIISSSVLSPKIVMHNNAYICRRSENNIKCVVHNDLDDVRTKQLNIFCHITGFMSDFLSFIVVELIRFFHVALTLP